MAEYIGQILYIKPNYIVSVPEFDTPRRIFSAARIKNEVNLRDNHHKNKLSLKAISRIKSAINWLVASAKEKKVYNHKTKKNYNFRVNLITLTLPDTVVPVSEFVFKKNLIHPFLQYLRKYHKLNNYVWKVEYQQNGKLHLHITTDTFIHHNAIRTIWNKQLERNGLLSDYTAKFQGCTFERYVGLCGSNDKRPIEQKRKAYKFGVESGWTEPNTTDVHAVWKVDNLGAYISKYMSKNEQSDKPLNGRIWGCNYELSAKNTCRVGVHAHEAAEVMAPFMRGDVEYKVIETQDKVTGKVFRQAEIFFIKPSHWYNLIHPKVRKVYDEHRFNIRNGIIPEQGTVFDAPMEIFKVTDIEPIKQKIYSQQSIKEIFISDNPGRYIKLHNDLPKGVTIKKRLQLASQLQPVV